MPRRGSGAPPLPVPSFDEGTLVSVKAPNMRIPYLARYIRPRGAWHEVRQLYTGTEHRVRWNWMTLERDDSEEVLRELLRQRKEET